VLSVQKGLKQKMLAAYQLSLGIEPKRKFEKIRGSYFGDAKRRELLNSENRHFG